MNKIHYYGKEIPVLSSYDTIVVGGGTAGAAAGIWSAKQGDKTLVVEKLLSLGGTAVNALVTPMMASHVDHNELFELIETELINNNIATRDQVSKALWFSSEKMAWCLEKLLCQYEGDILYDTTLIDCIKEEERIRYLIVSNVEGLQALEAKCFIDASGDAILSRIAQVPVFSGDDSGNNQATSLRFEMGGIDIKKYREYCQSLNDNFYPNIPGDFFESAMVVGQGFPLEAIFQKGVDNGELLEKDLYYYQAFTIPGKKGCMTFNCPRITSMKNNTTGFARSNGVIEGRKMIHRLVGFLHNNMPGFEHSFLMKEANMLGIRESFRISGKYILTEDDYINRRKFADGVVKGDWYIDVHSTQKGLVHKGKYEKGEYYEIPYGSLVCHEVSNLIVIGRCISTTFMMQASIRIQPTLIDMGQVAAQACVLSNGEHIQLNAIDGSRLKKS